MIEEWRGQVVCGDDEWSLSNKWSANAKASRPLEATTRHAMQRYNERNRAVTRYMNQTYVFVWELVHWKRVNSATYRVHSKRFRLFFPPVKRGKMAEDNLINSVFERKYLWEEKEPLHGMRILTMKLWNNFNLLSSAWNQWK